MNKKSFLLSILALGASLCVNAQSKLYPAHFDLAEVTLLDSPFKTSLETNNRLLLEYDVDRLLSPYVKQSGLAYTTDTQSKYSGHIYDFQQHCRNRPAIIIC